MSSRPPGDDMDAPENHQPLEAVDLPPPPILDIPEPDLVVPPDPPLPEGETVEETADAARDDMQAYMDTHPQPPPPPPLPPEAS